MPEQAITSLRKITLETFLIYDWEQCENEDRTLHKFQATIDFDNIKLPCKLIHISGDPKCDRPAVAMETINKQMAFIESDFKKQKPMSGELLWMVLEMMQIFSYSGRRREEVSLAHSVEASDEGESVVREPNDEVGEEEVEGRRRRS